MHKKNDLVRFVFDEDVDALALFNNLPIQTAFTTPKSLSFDRHTLSEKEEKKFNLRFAPFLRSLISSLDTPHIEILLEYMVRIYSIDTFNPHELIFLLLPFQKYFEQLKILAKNTNNKLMKLTAYSIQAISRIIIQDERLLMNFVQYFRNYESLKGFLNKVLNEVVELIKPASANYLGEMHRIMEHLINHGNELKALEIYHRMCLYLNTKDFIDLLTPHFTMDIIMSATQKANSTRNQKIYERKSGRHLLKNNHVYLCQYLEYLLSNNLTPGEFNPIELNALHNMLLGKPSTFIANPSNIESLMGLFLEIEPKDHMIRFIIKSKIQEHFVKYLHNKDKIYLLNTSFDLDYLTQGNYRLLIKNINKEAFRENYKGILERCLHFETFSPIHFDQPAEFDYLEIFKDTSPIMDAYKLNLIKFSDKFGIGLAPIFLENDLLNDRIVLSYLLTHHCTLTGSQFLEIVENAKANGSSIVIANLVQFICTKSAEVPVEFDFNGFLEWGMDNGFLSLLVSSMDMFTESQLRMVSPGLLYKLLVESGKFSLQEQAIAIFNILKISDPHVATKLYESENYDLILSLGSSVGFSDLLVPHHKTLDFIDTYHDVIKDHHSLVDFLLKDIRNPRCLSLLPHFLDVLIQFRASPSWDILKIILIEFLTEKHRLQAVFEYVLSHFDLFTAIDEDLFMKIFSGEVSLDIKCLGELPRTETAAAFIHSFLLSKKDINAMPILPKIVPLLIYYKKSSVVGLFERYSGIMGMYSKNVLQDYPEIRHVLANLEPRLALRELYSHLSPENFSILMNILENQICTSNVVFRLLCSLFRENLGTLVMAEHILTFVKFFTKSFVINPKKPESRGIHAEAKTGLSTLLVFIHTINPSMIYKIGREGLSINLAVFSECALCMAKDLVENTVNLGGALDFLCIYLEREKLGFEDPMAVYRHIFSAKDVLSPRFISLLAKNEISILENCITTLLSNISSDSDVLYSIELLQNIFCNVAESKEYRDKVLPQILLLSEAKDVLVSKAARKCIEGLRY